MPGTVRGGAGNASASIIIPVYKSCLIQPIFLLHPYTVSPHLTGETEAVRDRNSSSPSIINLLGLP